MSAAYHEVTKTQTKAFPSCLRAFVVKTTRARRLLLAILREIFDENAYARFLARRGLSPSRASYASFLAESRELRERRPRCC